jgi:hypothetical protein
MIGRVKLVAVATLLTAAACSSSSGGAASTCTGLPTGDPSAAMPPGLPPVPGQVLHDPSQQGKTYFVFGLVKTKDFVKLRDDYVTKLKAAGWHIDGTDQESAEAEAQFSKNPPLVAGTIKVVPFPGCSGYVRVRYKLSL